MLFYVAYGFWFGFFSQHCQRFFALSWVNFLHHFSNPGIHPGFFVGIAFHSVDRFKETSHTMKQRQPVRPKTGILLQDQTSPCKQNSFFYCSVVTLSADAAGWQAHNSLMVCIYRMSFRRSGGAVN